MPLYQYKATDAKGKSQSGLIDATSSVLAYQKLKNQGFFPTSVQEDIGKRGKAANSEALAFTVLQLAALLRCGIPVDEALESLLQTEENARIRISLARVRSKIREGEGMASAMASEEVFPPMLVRMVEAGEETGKPGEILGRYAEYLKRDAEHRQALAGALSYPIILGTMSVSLMAGLLYFLTPVLKEMYTSLGAEPPWITQFVLGVGGFLVSYGIVVVPLVIAVVFLLRLAIPEQVQARTWLAIPVLGPMLRCGLLERWSRTLGMLHQSGVPLVRALQLSRESLDNAAMNELLQVAETSVERGEGVAASLAKVYLIPPLLQQFLRTGEKTGEFDQMLDQAASFYERELERRRGLMVRFLEPALIMFLGIMVGGLVISVLLPLADISAKLNV